MSTTLSISAARSTLPTLIDKVSKNLERILITVNGQPKAAIMSLEELESLEETAEVLSIPGARESIKKGLREAKIRKGTLHKITQ